MTRSKNKKAQMSAPEVPPPYDPSDGEKRAIVAARLKHDARAVRVKSGLVNKDTGPVMTNPHSDGFSDGKYGCATRWVRNPKSL